MTLPLHNNFPRLRPFHIPPDVHQHSPMLRQSASEQKMLNSFLEEGSEQLTFHCPASKDPDQSPHETQKCSVKQGPVKLSKKFKETNPKSKGDNE